MSFWDRLFGRKASEARMVLSINQVGKAQPTPRNYEAFSREGYQLNVIGYKCVSLVSRACSGIEFELYQERKGSDPTELETHPLLDLLYKPNPIQGQSGFIESVIAYYLISGNSYVEAVAPTPGKAPLELWPLRPDKMKIIPGDKGVPMAYQFSGASSEKVFPVDQIKGRSPILHMKTFHPTDPWYGMSPIEAAIYSIDQHNEAGIWNLSLLKNMATPSGALVVKQDASNPAGLLPDAAYNNLKAQINEKYAGSKNAGRALLLEGGLDWKQMGFSPHDMDWMNGRHTSSRDIALAFGVPPIMLNIPGDSTFANYKEARLALYEDTIIPLMDHLVSELNKWLTPQFGEGIFLSYDVDSIEALAAKRAEKFAQVSGAGFLTVNEKRAAVGYEPLDGGDVLLVPSGQTNLVDFSAPPANEAPEEQDQEPPNADANPEEETTDAQDQASQDTQKVFHLEEEIKQINLVSKVEKQKTWRLINKRRQAFEEAFYQDLKSDFSAQARAIASAVRAVEPRLAEFAAVKAIDETNRALEKTLRSHIRKTIQFFSDPILNANKWSSPEMEMKTAVRFSQFVDSFVQRHTAQAITAIEGTSVKKARRIIKDIISDGIDEGDTNPDIAGKLEEEFVSLSTSRARMIARTEVGIASNQGGLEAIKALDIPGMKKEWVSVDDDRTRDDPQHADHASMNGVQVDIDEKFTVPPDASMDGPGDPSAGPEQIVNCRCVLTYSRGEQE